MAKFNKKDYDFIDLSETDHTQFSQIELDEMIKDTMEILAETKGKIKKTPMNLGLAAGVLAAQGGEFKSVNVFGARWKKGDVSKKDCKVIKKVFSTARLYYLFKVVIVLISKKDGQQDLFNPTLAKKKA